MESVRHRRANLLVQELIGLYAEGFDEALSTALKLLDEMYGQPATYTEKEAEMFRLGLFRINLRSRVQAKAKAKNSGARVPAYLVEAKKPYMERYYNWATGGKFLP